MVAAILIASLIVGGGAGVSVVAENALPGDALYGYKISVNEGIRGALALGAQADGKWSAKRADRRLREAEALMARGALSADVAAELKTNLRAHAEAVQQSSASLEGSERHTAVLEVNSSFEALLRAHERVLITMQGNSEAAELLVIVRDNVSTASAASARAEGNISVSTNVEAAANGKLRAAENKIREAGAFIARVESKLSAQANAEARARLEVAENTVAAGKVKTEAGAHGEAFVLYQKALRIASEAQTLAVARNEVQAHAELGTRSSGSDRAPDNESEGGAGAEAEAEASAEAGGGSVSGELEGEVELGL